MQDQWPGNSFHLSPRYVWWQESVAQVSQLVHTAKKCHNLFESLNSIKLHVVQLNFSLWRVPNVKGGTIRCTHSKQITDTQTKRLRDPRWKLCCSGLLLDSKQSIQHRDLNKTRRSCKVPKVNKDKLGKQYYAGRKWTIKSSWLSQSHYLGCALFSPTSTWKCQNLSWDASVYIVNKCNPGWNELKGVRVNGTGSPQPAWAAGLLF